MARWVISPRKASKRALSTLEHHRRLIPGLGFLFFCSLACYTVGAGCDFGQKLPSSPSLLLSHTTPLLILIYPYERATGGFLLMICCAGTHVGSSSPCPGILLFFLSPGLSGPGQFTAFIPTLPVSLSLSFSSSSSLVYLLDWIHFSDGLSLWSHLDLCI
jgi:hypothetical protein